ncbi:MAG: LLM class F420-dependent oxidoreductase [Frankiaceae bacterium]|jgi:F420-dependent oxidoreductase-like protein|nr:LLM class F420-dependent oxidoreductase [Frankiaceae bacterium]
MKLSAGLGLGGRRDFEQVVQHLGEMERAGIDIITCPEAWSFDAFAQLAFIAARTERAQLMTSIVNVFSRSATQIAASAATVDEMSGGRFILGVGSSGPQVVEGFWGVPFTKPLSQIVDVIGVCRMMWRRDKVVYAGKAVQVPVPPGRGTGLGKPLNLMNYPIRQDIPIWWAAQTPKAVEMAAEIADGWLPFGFIPERADRVWAEALAAGKARRAKDRLPWEVSTGVSVAIGENLPVQQLRDQARPGLALYLGGMGARGANFYNDTAIKLGFADEAKEIQDLYLDGHRDQAAAKVPAEWLEKTSMIGPRSYVKERLAAYREAGVTTLSIRAVGGQDQIATIEAMRTLVDEL